MTSLNIGCILMNIGTPDKPTTSSIRKYLKEFLSDPDVIDSNKIIRWMIVNLIVSPFRPKKILHQYESIWTKDGSPLLANSKEFSLNLSNSLPEFNIEIGMRYGNPSILKAVKNLKKLGINNILLIPMFPQYAQASSGSCIQSAKEIIKREIPDCKITVIEKFYSEDFYIKCLVEKISNSLEYKECEYLLFSFHGLPERQIKRLDKSGKHCLVKNKCCEEICVSNYNCYKAHCTQTVKKVVEQLKPSIEYSICFQSRFGLDKWLSPNITDVMETLSNKGIKKVAVACPSFTFDCLETLEEIAIRNNETFVKELNGEYLKLIPSLNNEKYWVKNFSEFIKRSI